MQGKCSYPPQKPSKNGETSVIYYEYIYIIALDRLRLFAG
jgi:hypothetical protein